MVGDRLSQVGRVKTPDSWVPPSVLAAADHLYWAVVTGRDLVRDTGGGGESRAEDWGWGAGVSR